MQQGTISPGLVFRWFATGLACIAILILIGVIVGVITATNAFGRWQARADASNRISLTRIGIQNAQQAAKIVYAQVAATKAEAVKRYQESIGIRESQDEISKTLTPLYIQYEAIQAEEDIATSGKNNTVIYVPASQGGVPVITGAGATH